MSIYLLIKIYIACTDTPVVFKIIHSLNCASFNVVLITIMYLQDAIYGALPKV